MKIPLINNYLKIEISKEPKLEKLERELFTYFDENEIEGMKIKKFKVVNSEIFPEIGERKLLYLFDDYNKEIEQIGKKYKINKLRFASSCY